MARLAWLRNVWLWAAVSTSLTFASLAVIYAATGITRPPLGCTVPQPPAKQAAFDLALDSMGNVASVANWLGVAGLVALAVGIVLVPPRSRVPLLALLLPVLVSIFVVYGLGHDMRTAADWCTS